MLDITFIYRPPSGNSNEFLDSLDQFLLKRQRSNKKRKIPFCIIGDINVDLLLNNRLSSSYINTLTSYNLKQTVETPTRFCKTRQSLLDHIILDESFTEYKISTFPMPCTDHEAICLRWNRTLQTKNYVHKLIEYRSFKNFRPDDFLTELENVDWNIFYGTKDPDECWIYLRDNIMALIDKYAPMKQIKVKNKVDKPWFTSDIKKEICEHTNDFWKPVNQLLKKKSVSNDAPNASNISSFFVDIIKDIINEIPLTDLNPIHTLNNRVQESFFFTL